MKVKVFMAHSAICCGPETNVGRAVESCGNGTSAYSPFVDNDGKLIGALADRDICIAMGTRNRLPGELTVGEIAIQKVFTCKSQ